MEASVDGLLLFLNLHHNSEHANAVISGTGPLQENGIFRFLKIHKNIAFYPNLKIFWRSSRNYPAVNAIFTAVKHYFFLQNVFKCCQKIVIYLFISFVYNFTAVLPELKGL